MIVNIDDLPIDFYEEFVTKEFCYVESGQDEYDLVDMDELSDEKREELNHQSRGYDEEGYALEISVEDLIKAPDNYSEVLRELCYDSFPMKLEYYALWDLLDEMKKGSIMKIMEICLTYFKYIIKTGTNKPYAYTCLERKSKAINHHLDVPYHVWKGNIVII